MLSTLSTLFVASIGLIAHVNSQTVDLSGVYLNAITYGGTGCPQGSFVKQQSSSLNKSVFPTLNSNIHY
jgi:hypothetical protein